MVVVIVLILFSFTVTSSAVILQEAEMKPTIKEDEQSSLSTYIVHVEKPEGGVVAESDLDSWYKSYLPVTTLRSTECERLVFSYKNVLTGFAAKLTAEEVEAMKEKEGFVSARPEKVFSLHTTHSPNFLGFHQGVQFWNQSSYGAGVILGLLDTGVTPGHPSFNDEGMPPPPAKWKGQCELNWTACNNKLIGARNFVFTGVKAKPPVDDVGHGTHTASTAAGSFVQNANVFGQANGTAAGMAPLAHLAMYKVCGPGCREAAILAAMDSAIEDGVDVLSLSLGGSSVPFYADWIAIGAFRAIQKGIFVSCSAGNEGPSHGSLSNEAPWILTVGASTIDRSIRATATLGNEKEFDGESLFQADNLPSKLLPLVYPGANGEVLSATCSPGSLKNADVKGKVVLCERDAVAGSVQQGREVKEAGGAAMILMNGKLNGYSIFADPHVLPATQVSYKAGLSIKAYINSTSTAKATILFEGTVIGKPTAPEVTSFSSRGPNRASPGILKPDVIGPGVSILAAWHKSLDNSTNKKSTFNMISGTSMSCPHLSGIAALLKSSHPDWSPAAIKSAIMTTARLSNLEGKPIVDQTMLPADLYTTGSGLVNPSMANDPGLIYDNQPDDYIPYLCGLGYSNQEIRTIVQQKVNCSNVKKITEAELNYPSFSVLLGSSPQTYTRTVTNVGPANLSYTFEIIEPEGVDVIIKTGMSNVIMFTEVNQKATYSVTLSRRKTTKPFSQGYLKWVSAKHIVTSPIVVTFHY